MLFSRFKFLKIHIHKTIWLVSRIVYLLSFRPILWSKCYIDCQNWVLVWWFSAHAWCFYFLFHICFHVLGSIYVVGFFFFVAKGKLNSGFSKLFFFFSISCCVENMESDRWWKRDGEWLESDIERCSKNRESFDSLQFLLL